MISFDYKQATNGDHSNYNDQPASDQQATSENTSPVPIDASVASSLAQLPAATSVLPSSAGASVADATETSNGADDASGEYSETRSIKSNIEAVEEFLSVLWPGSFSNL